MVAAAFLDLLHHYHGLLDTVIDVEAVAIAAGAAGPADHPPRCVVAETSQQPTRGPQCNEMALLILQMSKDSNIEERPLPTVTSRPNRFGPLVTGSGWPRRLSDLNAVTI
jgi:hypothetical protein